MVVKENSTANPAPSRPSGTRGSKGVVHRMVISHIGFQHEMRLFVRRSALLSEDSAVPTHFQAQCPGSPFGGAVSEILPVQDVRNVPPTRAAGAAVAALASEVPEQG